MTVKSEEGRIILEGRCRVEDAEALLGALLRFPGSVVDVGAAESLHTAVLQILLTVKPRLSGTAKHQFLARYVLY